MMKKVLLSVLFLACLAVLGACSSQSLTADTLPWIADTPVLFRDDFSSESGGWSTHADAVSFAGYDQGRFRLWVDVPFYHFWSVPGLHFQDTLVFTRAIKQAGPENNLFGILCRYQDSRNFYALVIGSDGYYGIFKSENGSQSLIGQEHMDFNEVIRRGEADNEIQAVCQGDQLVLIVNGVKLLQVQDGTFPQGDVGLIAGSFLEPGVDIYFDDFIVVKP